MLKIDYKKELKELYKPSAKKIDSGSTAWLIENTP